MTASPTEMQKRSGSILESFAGSGDGREKKGKTRVTQLQIRQDPSGKVLRTKAELDQDTLRAFAKIENAQVLDRQEVCSRYNAKQEPPPYSEIPCI